MSAPLKPVRERMSRLSFGAWAQLAVVALIPFAFIVSAAFSSLPDKAHPKLVIVEVALASALLGICVVGCARAKRRADNVANGAGSRLRSWISNRSWPLASGALVCAMRLPFLADTTYCWDSLQFLRALEYGCTMFRFTPWTFFQYFALCGHASFGYSLIAAVGRYLTPQSMVGLNVITMLLLAIALFFLTKLVLDLLPTAPPWAVCAAVSLVGMEPMILGTFGLMSIDGPLVPFTILVLCAEHDHRYVLEFLCVLLVCFTKETGLCFAAAYGLCHLVASMHGAARGARIKALLRDSGFMALVWAAAAVVLVFLAGYLVKGSKVIWGGLDNVSSEIVNGGDPSMFGFFPDYVVDKLKAMFVLNFAWVFAAICVAGTTFELVRGRRGRAEGVIGLLGSHVELASYFAGLLGLALLGIAYFTWNNPRYLAPNQAGLVLLAALFLLVHLRKPALLAGCVAALAGCCLLEGFSTVDPMTAALFRHVDTGSSEVLVTTESRDRPDAADSSVYNHQAYGYERCVAAFLSEIGYDGTQEIIVWNNARMANRTEISFPSLKTTERNRGFFIRWNAASGCRTLEDDLVGTVPIAFDYTGQWRENARTDKLADDAVVVFSSRFPLAEGTEQEALKELSQYYDVGPKTRAIDDSDTLYYYELVRKQRL